MARQRIQIADLKKAAERLSTAAKRIAISVETAEKAGMTEVLIHWATIGNRFLPRTTDWAVGVEKDVAVAAEAAKERRPSTAELNVAAYKTRQAAGKKRKKAAS